MQACYRSIMAHIITILIMVALGLGIWGIIIHAEIAWLVATVVVGIFYGVLLYKGVLENIRDFIKGKEKNNDNN